MSKPRLRTLAPRVTAMAGSRLAVAPKPSQQSGYRIRGRALQTIRARHFAENPLCVACLAQGLVTVAVELDHVVPLHQGGVESRDPFVNRAGLCAQCHLAKSIAEQANR